MSLTIIKYLNFIERLKMSTTIITYNKYLRNKNSKYLPKHLLKMGNKYLGIQL